MGPWRETFRIHLSHRTIAYMLHLSSLWYSYIIHTRAQYRSHIGTDDIIAFKDYPARWRGRWQELWQLLTEHTGALTKGNIRSLKLDKRRCFNLKENIMIPSKGQNFLKTWRVSSNPCYNKRKAFFFRTFLAYFDLQSLVDQQKQIKSQTILSLLGWF